MIRTSRRDGATLYSVSSENGSVYVPQAYDNTSSFLYTTLGLKWEGGVYSLVSTIHPVVNVMLCMNLTVHSQI